MQLPSESELDTPQRPSAIGPIREVTVVTADAERSADLYCTALGWRRRAAARELDSGVARRWGAPGLFGCPVVEVGPATGPVLRLVELPNASIYPALRSRGWAALEVLVVDAAVAVEAAEKAGFDVLARPRRLGAGGTLPLVAGQVAGPGGETVYLTQFLAPVPGFELPDPVSQVGQIFICVLGAGDLPSTREVLEARFALRRVTDRRSPVGVLNTVRGLPADTEHRLSSLQLAGRCVFEIDEFGVTLPVRQPTSIGLLAGGIAVVGVDAPGCPEAVVRLPDDALLELLPS